jgi:hypothetical protein
MEEKKIGSANMANALPSSPTATQPLRVGVLALQGAFAEHVNVLVTLGINPVLVRTPAQLADVDALILPGGGVHDDGAGG